MTPGDRLAGRYEVKEAIAARPTGTLYRGFDEQIGVEVALRFVDEHLLADESDRQRFVQRARRGKALQHPNILRLYDVVVDGGVVFLVLQWAPGERLSRRLLRGPLPPDEARNVIRRVASGVAHAHQQGVVLGNLAADTVLLYPDDVKLSNVGIGPALPREHFLAAMAGRMEDLAPEVRGGGALEERADVYAVARLARTLLEGHLNAAAVEVLERGLGDATQRPRDVEAFVRELDAALDGRDLDRVQRIFPTGADTERVERLPPLPTEGGGTRHDALSPEERATKSEPLELDASDLVEVPDVTDAGHRRAREGTPKPAAAPVPPVAVAGKKPSRPFAQPEDDEQTRRHEKLASPFDSVIERGTAAERLPDPELEAVPSDMPHPHAMWLPLLLLVAVALGGFGTWYAMHVTRPKVVVMQAPSAPRPTAVPTPTATPMPSPLPSALPILTLSPSPLPMPPSTVSPSPSPTTLPSPSASPTPTPTVTSLAMTPAGACPLGMAVLPSPRPFCVDMYEYPGGKTIPRTNVSLADAKAVCASRSLRLCSDAEWELACRGPALASYPYGSSFDASRCNAGRGMPIAEAGAMPKCRSAAGAYDMSGNVAEWTLSGSQRGGSALQSPANGRCSHIVHGADPVGAADVGFRCCGDL